MNIIRSVLNFAKTKLIFQFITISVNKYKSKKCTFVFKFQLFIYL